MRGKIGFSLALQSLRLNFLVFIVQFEHEPGTLLMIGAYGGTTLFYKKNPVASSGCYLSDERVFLPHGSSENW